MHIHTYTQTRAHVIPCVYRGVHAHTHAHTQVHMHACVRPSQPILTVSTALGEIQKRKCEGKNTSVKQVLK